MANRNLTPLAQPAAKGWLGRLLTLSAFKLTLVWTLLFVVLRLVEIRGSESSLPVVRTLEHALGDLRFRERLGLGLAKVPEYVVIVEADEKSIHDIGFWPWSRSTYADLITKLTGAGATAIVFDIGFMDDRASEKAGDEALAAAIKSSGRSVQGFILLNSHEGSALSAAEQKDAANRLEHATIGPIRLAREKGLSAPMPEVEPYLLGYTTARAPIAALAAVSNWFGFVNAFPDDDGVVRRTQLVARLGDMNLPSIDVGGFGVACGAAAPRVITPLADEATREGLSALDIPCASADARVPVDLNGEMLLNFQVDWTRVPRVSTIDVLRGDVGTAQIAGKIALVAATAEGTHDLRSSPVDRSVPGGVTHAAALEQMVSGRYLQRPNALRLLELLLLLLLGVGFGWLFSTLPPLPVVGALILGLFATHALTLGAFLLGYDTVSALPLILLVLLALTAQPYRFFAENKDKRFIRRAFGHYLSPAVLDAVLADPSKLRLGGERRDMTVLFSDVRGFTTLSETLQPEELVTLLNEYLTPMTDIVFEHKGALDKYIGDAIMAYFGAPLDQPDHPLAALKTAEAMIQKLAALNEGWKSRGMHTLDIGIGVSSGPMVWGNMGSETFRNYTVMGDSVNLGSRLEGTTKVYGARVILSEETEKATRGKVTTRQLDAVRVKGKHQPVKIYELISVGPPPADWKEILPEYQRGIELYRARSFAEALVAFARVRTALPKDKPAEIYVERCTQLISTPPPPNWDGVYDLKTK